MALNQEAVRGVCVNLRARAKRLRRGADAALVLIFVALISCLAIFIYAGEITAREAGLIRSLMSKTGLPEHIRVDGDRGMEQLQQTINELKDRTSPKPLTAVDKLGGEVQLLQSQVLSLHVTVRTLITEMERGQAESVPQVVSTAITRVGAGLLLVFLVQILVISYRYSIRLATYLESRADALELTAEGGEEVLERLEAVLALQTLDFGRTPPTPSQHSLQLFRDTPAPTKGKAL